MIKTVQLLEDKNSYLEKFVALNTQKLKKLAAKDFNGLEEFRETRENILNIIKHIDDIIENRLKDLDVMLIPQETKNYIQGLLNQKDAYVHTILAQDLEIMEIIDEAKSHIIVELQKVGRSKKTMGSYKGFEEKEETLDEEF